MAKYDYDVIVIGAGPGGSTCAALLAKWGLKTLVLDKNPRAGGTMMTYCREGFTYEMFPVFGVPAYGDKFSDVIREIGIEDKVETFRPDPLGLMCYEDETGKINKMVSRGGTDSIDPNELFAFLNVKEDEMEATILFLAELTEMKPHEVDRLDDLSVNEFLDRYTLPHGLRVFIACLMAEGNLEMPADVASASEFIRCFQDSATGGAIRYYGGGFGGLFEKFCDTVKENGGELIFDNRVKKIEVEDGSVSKVVSEKGAFSAPIVISNAGIQPTVLKLIDKEHFDKSYINWVKGLVPSLGFCGYRYFLNRRVLEYPYIGYISYNAISTSMDIAKSIEGEMPEAPYLWLQTNSLFPGMAPEGKQLIHTGITCPPDPNMDYTPWREKLEEIIAKVIPELLDCIDNKEPFGPEHVPALSKDAVLPGQGGECIGLAQIVGQTGKYKPSIKGPIGGLFYVGTDAGGYGLGTHSAATSGVNVARTVIKYHHTHGSYYRSG